MTAPEFRAEGAISPADGAASWVVVDADLALARTIRATST